MASGKKTGGRAKGTPNKVTIRKEAEIAASGLTPLDYMMSLVRAETPAGLDVAIAVARETLRFEAAKAAAPYVHPRLSAVEHSGTLGIRRAEQMSDDELAGIATSGSDGASEEAPSKALLN